MANIEINDRLYNDFVVWSKANNMSDDDMRRYIEKAFQDRFMIDKYGDLNEKIKELHKEKDVEKPKRKRTTKKSTAEQQPEIPSEPINEPINEPICEEKPKRKTKVIASK